MGTAKRSPPGAAPAAQKMDGDLFPRGRAAGSVARVRKRDGTVLFGGAPPPAAAGAEPPRKRARTAPPAAADELVSKHALSAKRLSIGMTAVGVVTAVSERAVDIALPAGIRACADPFEVLVEESAAEAAARARKRGGPFPGAGGAGVTDDEDVDMLSNSETDEGEGGGDRGDGGGGGTEPLCRVVAVGDVLRVALVSTEKAASGTYKTVVSCRPSLINVNVGVVGGGAVSAAQSTTGLRQGELVWGAVKAVEDHGYLVDFGASVPALGFLHFADAGVGARLRPGTPVDALVLESQRVGKKTRKVVRVSLAAAAVNAAVSSAVPDMSIAALRAGVRVHARVTRVDAVGAVELSVFSTFSAVVERAHVPHDAAPTVGATVDARLLYVDAGSKRIGATMLPCMVEERTPRRIPPGWTVGHVIPSVAVVRVDPGYGVVLQQVRPAGDGAAAADWESVPLFAHASRVSDERVDKLETAFHAGLRPDAGARIVSFSPLDGVVNVDLRPSILARKALSVGEVVPGERYDCKAVSHSAAGSLIVAVDGDERIRGVVPSVHLSDTVISVKRLAMHSRFKVGANLACVALSADAEKGKVVLTCKRSLVHSKHPMLASYEQAQAALKAAASAPAAGADDAAFADDMCVFDGSVATVTERLGVLVVFLAGVCGMVPEKELFADYGGQDKVHRTRAQVEALFPVGRTVAVRVLHVDVGMRRMALSFNLQRRKHGPRSKSVPVLAPGTFVGGSISSVDEEARSIVVRVRVPESRTRAEAAKGPDSSGDVRVAEAAVASTGSKVGGPAETECTIECRLPFDHLSDFPDLARRIAAEYVKCSGAAASPVAIDDALVLTEGTGSRPPLVTLKTSLIAACRSGALPKTMQVVSAIHSADKGDGDGDGDASDKGNSRRRTVLRGYVKAALPSGVIVGFLSSIAGLARKSRISDDFVADPSEALAVHQSVGAVVENVDPAADRFTVSLRRSDVGMDPVVADTRSYFEQLRGVTERFGGPAVEADFPVGAVVDSILDKSRPYGMVLSLTSATGSKAFGVVLEQAGAWQSAASPAGTCTAAGSPTAASVAESESIATAAFATAQAHAEDLTSTPAPKGCKKRAAAAASTRKTRGQRAAEEHAATAPTPARVLDVDPFTGVVDVSLDPAVVESAGKRVLSSTGEKVVDATVLLVKEEYAILSVPRGKGKSAIAFALLPAIRQQLRLLLRQGLVVRCTIIASKGSRRNMVAVDWLATASALASAKNASVAKGLSDRRKAKEDAKAAKAAKGDKAVPVTADNVAVGMTVTGRVTATFPTQTNVSIARGLVGRIHVTNGSSLSSAAVQELPLGCVHGPVARKCSFSTKEGTILKGLTVLSVREAELAGKTATDDGAEGEGRNGDAGEQSSSRPISVELGVARKNQGALPVEAGSQRLGFVKHVKVDEAGRVSGLWLELTPTLAGYCAGLDALAPKGDDLDGDSEPAADASTYVVGSPVVSMVSRGPEEGGAGRVNVVVSPNGKDKADAFWGRVLSVRPGEGVRVEIPWLARRDGHKDKWWALVNMCDVCDDYDDTVEFCKAIKAGQLVRVRSLPSEEGGDDAAVHLSMRASVVGRKLGDEPVEVRDPALAAVLDKRSVGQAVRGFVRSVGKSGCFVSIGTLTVARVLLSDLADQFVTKPEDAFPAGKLVAGKISFVDGSDASKVQLSLRTRKRQALEGCTGGDAAVPESKRARRQADKKESAPREGAVVKVVVTRIEKFGAIVAIPGLNGTSALLHKSEADQDRKVTDPWAEWSVGQRLTAVALQPGDDRKCRVGTKRCYFEAAGLDEDKVDEILEANERKVTTGEVNDVDVSMAKEAKGEGAAVVDDSSSGDVDSDSGSGSGGAGAGGGDAGSGADSNSDESSAGDADGDVATGDHASGPLESDGESESESESGSEGRGALPIARGFVFDDAFEGGVGSAKAEEDSESEVDNESDDAQMAGSDSRPKRSSREKRDKKRAKEDAEREIREREHALATRPDTPETAEDFERLLMGQPNASELWIRYMAFRVSLAQFEKARALAERALETVALPEELERVNIWIAYVNLEASCGTGESVASEEVSAAALRNRAAAVFRVFDRACQRVTDVKDLHLQVAAALRQSHPDIANEVLQRALKSFKSSTKVWCAVGAAQFSAGKLEGGRQTLERALLSLDKQKHVALIMKFAQLEYRHGSSERGRTVFSSLCANFPKRLDLWSVYLDMEVGRYRAAAKDGDAAEVEAALASVRMLFERCVTLDLSTKKTKFVFTRWLSFEVETGDKAAQSRVRSKARAYVETRLVPS